METTHELLYRQMKFCTV